MWHAAGDPRQPWEKYVHVVHGRAYNVVVDLRDDSDTYGTWWAGELDRTTAIFLSRGLGNGYQALTEGVMYSYLVSEHWRSDVTYPAVAWDDPDLAIPWPITDARLQLSARIGAPTAQRAQVLAFRFAPPAASAASFARNSRCARSAARGRAGRAGSGSFPYR